MSLSGVQARATPVPIQPNVASLMTVATHTFSRFAQKTSNSTLRSAFYQQTAVYALLSLTHTEAAANSFWWA